MEVDGTAEAGTAAAGGAKPLTPEEEALRRSTDCVYFLASPLTCKKVRRARPRFRSPPPLIASLFGSPLVFWAIGACSSSHEAGSVRG